MMNIEYSEAEGFEVLASLDDFKNLKSALISFLTTPVNEMTIEADTHFTPFENSKIISRLIVKKTTQNALVSLSSNQLLITGSVRALEALSSYFNFENNAQFPEHSHFEYYDGHPIIHPEAVPIVFTVAKQNGSCGLTSRSS